VYNRERALNAIGQVKNLVNRCGIDWKFKPNISPSEEQINLRNNLINQINEQINSVPVNELENLELAIEPDLFMEILINNVRNEVVSYQAFFCKEKNAELADALRNLNNLKKNYPENSEAIKVLENKVTALNEENLKIELANYSMFEYLNNEKITPKFLNLARAATGTATLEQIHDDSGRPFNCADDRKNFVRNYVSNTFKSTPGKINAYEGCIEDFLGNDILVSELVTHSKLSEDQKNSCERDLTLFELDTAAESLRNSSAGGPDGISVKFVKKYWGMLRLPVRNYAKCCITKGSLTENFKTASIRMIPKKGNSNDIKNWRPISLLNVLYKVLSKSLNNRLKKIAGKILSRSQKGFTQDRYIQECLINIMEGVHWCKKNHIKPKPLILLTISF
jgi:Reverse transcriptase (RNA-dependent DNA polymerase)